ncbi:OsmC family protein [Chryseobacterium salivictor]|uniref:OsmC family protein n=1 Tax=Chryseobacterium salivictor TaxID=2547600 RepID=UPI001C863CA2|nr:OsmC family protein [Chryseobacterium salivictor]
MAGEPKEKGGQDKGFSPKELLVSALAACTSATVGMYSDRKATYILKLNSLKTMEKPFLKGNFNLKESWMKGNAKDF